MVFTSPHAFADEALMILSIDPRIKNNRKYLSSAAKLDLVKRFPRGSAKYVYDRATLKELATNLDLGLIKLDTSNYSFLYDFQTK